MHAITQHLRRNAAAYFVLLIMLLVTGAAWYAAVRYVEVQGERRFAETVHTTTLAIQRRIEVYVNALYGVRALFHHNKRVERREFQAYVASIELARRYPGIQGLAYIRRVSRPGAPAYAETLRRELSDDPCGYPPLGKLPPDARDEYFLAVLVEPIARNLALFGKDLALDPACREAMERARDTDALAATRRVLFRHADRDKPGVILMLPIYAVGAQPETIAERRRALIGFVSATLLTPDLFPSIFGNPVDPAIDFEVFDDARTDTEHLFYDDDRILRAMERAPGERYHEFRTLEVGGRRWGVYFSTRPQFETEINYQFAWTVLVGGMVLSLLLFRITLAQSRHLTERQAQAQALEYQATHDSLTGLANRDLLYERVERSRAAGAQGHAAHALLLIDLDGFKEINDTLGHHSGDQLLRHLGPRLQSALRSSDILARLGGDEFAVWATGVDTGEASAKAKSLLEKIRQAFDLEGLKVRIDASIGIAHYPKDGAAANTLMRCADVAMYNAKQAKSGYAAYERERDPYKPHRLSLMNELAEAIQRDQLVLHYQPVRNIKQKNVTGVEALVRWQHPKQGLLPPAEFIALAETSALITPLTLWVADRALAQWRRWRRNGADLTIAINISARNLLDSELADKFAELLKKHEADARRIELEITESAIIADPDRALDTLTQLHALGMRIAIDDFGTGYSSLAYLKKLPVSTLKIDISFVRDMQHDDNDALIVYSTVNLAHSLGMDVVAEGVETQEVLEILEIIGCDRCQGFHICPPVADGELSNYLKMKNLG